MIGEMKPVFLFKGMFDEGTVVYHFSGLCKELISRVTLWQTLNYIRVALFIIISLGLSIKLINFKY
jgi:hypothetical protein